MAAVNPGLRERDSLKCIKQVIFVKSLHCKSFSWVTASPFVKKKLNLGFPRYRTKRTKFIVIVKKNLKTFEIIECTCTTASISNISRFAWANVWSVCVIASRVYVAFARVCYAFVNIFQNKRKKREKNEKWDLVFIQESYKYMYEKSRILVCNFLVSCDSRAGPVSQTAILEIFSRRYSKYQLKHTLLTALIMPREHKTRHTNNERENERKEIIHDHISLLFTCAIFSISSISRLTIAYMWSNVVAAVCILVTRVVSFTLVNVYEIRDKKNEISKLSKKCLSYAITVLKSASHGCFQLFAELREREIVVHEEKSYLCKKLSRDNF